MKRLCLSLPIVLIGFIAGLSSCNKDELTKPANVKLLLALSNEEVNMRTDSKQLVKIERARYRFSGIDFKGFRQAGGDYFFSRDFEGGLEVIVDQGQAATVIDFDMPQGVYDRMNISMKVKKSASNPSGIPYNIEAPLILEGFYTNAHQENVPLIFIYNYDDELDSSLNSGRNALSVSQNGRNQAEIHFNQAYWLQLVNGRMFQSAKLTQLNGTPTIILSENSNEHIFNLLTSRIKNASELTFK